MKARVKATYKAGGRLEIDIDTLDGKSMFSYNATRNLWRGDNNYCRPKWGLYRSTDGVMSSLNDAKIQMANFCISKS